LKRRRRRRKKKKRRRRVEEKEKAKKESIHPCFSSANENEEETHLMEAFVHQDRDFQYRLQRSTLAMLAHILSRITPAPTHTKRPAQKTAGGKQGKHGA